MNGVAGAAASRAELSASVERMYRNLSEQKAPERAAGRTSRDYDFGIQTSDGFLVRKEFIFLNEIQNPEKAVGIPTLSTG